MATEDFTFPIFSDTFSSSIDSPPLWRLSPAASPDSCHYKTSRHKEKEEEQQQQEEEKEDSSDEEEQEEEEEEEEYKDCFPIYAPIKNTQRKSFSWIEKGNSRLVNSDDEEEEKMDMLWEDFNEELSLEGNQSSSFGSDHKGCVQLQSLRLSRNSSAVVSNRKPTSAAGFVEFIKVLKKLFLLHNSKSHSHRSVQNHRPRTRPAKTLSW